MYNCEDTENSDQESENSHQEIETQEISDFDSVEALVKEVFNKYFSTTNERRKFKY